MTVSDIDPRLGPSAKIERAKEHLAEFDREVNGFIASDPYKFRLHEDPDGAQHLILDSHKPIPLRWSTIIGDVIHNSRSALDLLIACSTGLETGSFKQLTFPIFRYRADFEKKGLNKFGQNCPRTVRFLKLLKPYERGNNLDLHSNTLVLLNRLSVRDKHRLIIPIGTAAGYAVVTPEPGHGEPFKLFPPDTALLQNGETIMTVSPHDPLFANKKFNTKLTTQIRLSGVEPSIPLGASSVLHHIAKVVDRIVNIAERHLFR